MIKTFRGQLAEGEQRQIHLSGGDIDKGYRIVKLQLMCVQPGASNQESVVKIYKNKQSSVPTTSPTTIDFDEDN